MDELPVSVLERRGKIWPREPDGLKESVKIARPGLEGRLFAAEITGGRQVMPMQFKSDSLFDSQFPWWFRW